MAQSDPNINPRTGGVALIVGGGPGISASCARLFAAKGMKVAIAARSADKPVLLSLRDSHGICVYGCQRPC
jgi:NAD(P)-dependent dehydrogenase (short-subunit alcohol dehydrogenase family)